MPYIPLVENQYILHMLSNANDEQVEINLERLCEHLRKGRFPNSEHPYANLLKGLVQSRSLRIRRWALNAIAELGKRNYAEYGQTIEQAVVANRDDPLLLSTAVAAFFAVCPDDLAVCDFLSRHKIPIEGALLVSASQNSSEMARRLTEKKINIDLAEPLELQNAALLLGMNKNAPGIFHPTIPDKQIIGKLNLHPDPIVSQYSIWAIAENDNFAMEDLGVNIKDIESRLPKQRKWMLMTIVKNPSVAESCREIIEACANDSCPEVRETLASGLKDVMYQDMPEMTLKWLSRERRPEVVQGILVHMAVQSEHSPDYKETVIQMYRGLAGDSPERLRLQAACEKTPLYQTFRRIDYEEEGTLFGFERTTNVNNQTINFNGGNPQVSGVTNSGDITDNAFKNIQKIENAELRSILQDVLEAVRSSNVSAADKAAIAGYASQIAEKAEPSRIAKLLEHLKTINTLGQFGLLIAKVSGLL